MVKGLIDKTLFKFILIGVVNTLLGMAIMFGLYNLAGASYWLATAANYVLVSFLSYFLNKRFTFGYQGRVLTSGLRFAANIAACYLLAYGIAKPWTMAALEGQNQSLQENAAMLVGMCLFTGFNYIGQRLLVFPEVKKKKPGISREELEKELERVLAKEDDPSSGKYYDREEARMQQRKLIQDRQVSYISTEPPEEVAQMIREAESGNMEKNVRVRMAEG